MHILTIKGFHALRKLSDNSNISTFLLKAETQRELNYHSTVKFLLLKLVKTYYGSGKLVIAFGDHLFMIHQITPVLCCSRDIVSTLRNRFGLFVEKYF